MKVPKIILARPKLVVDTKCPKCRSFEIKAMKDIDFTCRNCNTKFTTEPNLSIYQTIAMKITREISRANEIIIQGERDDNKVFHPDDMLKPRSRYEEEIWSTMLSIKKDYDRQKCYEVSEITNEYDQDYKIRCNDCGTCLNCVTCTKCSKPYVPKVIKKTNEKRYTCPNCNSKSYKKTPIKFKKKACPHCHSESYTYTKFNADKTKCPKCGSNNISKPRNVPVYRLIIKRQKRFERDE